jgi:hypothetical protein
MPAKRAIFRLAYRQAGRNKMNVLDNTKAMEVLEKQAMYNYFEKLINARINKVVLFSIFPYTAAPNLSDPHYFVMVDDLVKIASLNSGNILN